LKYYISRGVGDEKRVENKKLFELIKTVATKHARELDLGGNASTMALRAFLEGCRMSIGFPLNTEYFEKYFKGDKSRVEVIGGLREINDYHISLNYYITDKIWNIDIPRSNRIFLNRDEDNNKMVTLDDFLENLDDLDIIALSGTQLPADYDSFVEKLNKVVEKLILPENLEKQVHLESSAFNNNTFYETQLDILLKRVP
jgi:ADP-specific Phosphofructokinase/Glucokinase conserved region